MLSARDVGIEVGGRRLLSGATFTVRAREKVGLVGRNGAGKTSLLQVLAGDAAAAEGVVLRRGALGYLPQDPRPRGVSAETTALSHVLSGRGLDGASLRLEKLRLRVDEDPSGRNVSRYSRAHDDYERAGGYAAEPEARRIAAGLGLAADRLDARLAVLSGGERRRVELARILFGGSDLLLLDEPTNHLDSDAKMWLLAFLRSYRGALLVVSHDIELLDDAITRVLHLDAETLDEYKGTYTQYRTARARDEVRLTRVAARQQAEIARLKAIADVARHQTESRARLAKTLDTRVERLRANAVNAPKHERRYRVRLPDPPHSGRTVLDATGLTVAYDGPPVFTGISFAVERKQRLLVMGLNGAGKTSLLRVLAGESTANAGAVSFGTGVSTGYYAQEHEGIAANRAVLDHLRDESVAPDRDLRGLLGMFGLTGDIAFQDAGTLSGGEKTKLALARLVAGRHNLLLLDEPTNNLDPPSREAVAGALAQWRGTIVLVSHDPEFVAALEPDRVLLMPEGIVDFWSPDLLDLVALA